MKNQPSPAAAKITTPTELLARCQALLGQPVDSEQLMELVMQLLAQELIAAKLQGKAISDNFDIVDRLLRYESLKQRRLNARTRELKAQAKAAEYSQKVLIGLRHPSRVLVCGDDLSNPKTKPFTTNT